jgi:catechol 2,3-dioxygenase-like lactoylglutathione lyase family enzyme
MLARPKLTGFAASTDLERSRSFYVDVLGCEFVELNEYACVLDVDGAQVRVTLVERFEPQGFTVLGFRVPDVQAEVANLRDRGVEFLEYDGLEQDADRVWRVPGGAGAIAWFKDPDGNVLSLQGPAPDQL